MKRVDIIQDEPVNDYGTYGFPYDEQRAAIARAVNKKIIIPWLVSHMKMKFVRWATFHEDVVIGFDVVMYKNGWYIYISLKSRPNDSRCDLNIETYPKDERFIDVDAHCWYIGGIDKHVLLPHSMVKNIEYREYKAGDGSRAMYVPISDVKKMIDNTIDWIEVVDQGKSPRAQGGNTRWIKC